MIPFTFNVPTPKLYLNDLFPHIVWFNRILIFIPVMLYCRNIGYNLALKCSMELEVSLVLSPKHVFSDNTLGPTCGFYIKIQPTLGRKHYF